MLLWQLGQDGASSCGDLFIVIDFLPFPILTENRRLVVQTEMRSTMLRVTRRARRS